MKYTYLLFIQKYKKSHKYFLKQICNHNTQITTHKTQITTHKTQITTHKTQNTNHNTQHTKQHVIYAYKYTNLQLFITYYKKNLMSHTK